MKVRQLVPDIGALDLTELVDRFAAPPTSPRPFAPEVAGFCAELAAALSRNPEARTFPELQSLAFWMRRAELQRLRDEFDLLQTRHTLLVPRGVVFHLPPSNVDTMFVYSWVLSLLAGNQNIVRLSDRSSRQSAVICATARRLLEASDYDVVRRSTAIITYGHDAAITGAISAVADVRVIWGGDRTVAAIRSIPLPPHARELTFGDRSSFCVIAADVYLELDAAHRRSLAERFYNDGYWFDQMACSSPRLVVWCGAAGAAAAAGRCFFEELHQLTTARGYSVDTSTALNKFTYSCRAILDTAVTRYERRGNALTVLTLEEGADIPADHCGSGLFYETRVHELSEVAGFVGRRDQTMTHFGFTREALYRLGTLLNGQGVDRIVPIGQALAFNRFWDGLDLLQEMTRRVYVEAEGQ